MTTAAPSTAKPAERVFPLGSVASNWAGLAINGALSVALTPILIHGLGDVYFGMWVLVTSLLDSSWLLDFGMRTAVFTFVARHWGARQREQLNLTFASGFAVAIASAGVILLLVTGSVWFLPHFFSVSGAARVTFRSLLIISTVPVAVMFAVQFLWTFLCALRRFDLYNLGCSGNGISRAVLILVALHLHWGILGVAVASLVTALLALPVSLYMVKVADPELEFHIRNVKASRIRELLAFSYYAFLGTVGDQLRFCVDSIVIGRVLTLAMITPFSIAGRLLFLFRQLTWALVSPFSGMMGELQGQQLHKHLSQCFLFSTRVTSFLGIFFALLLAINGGPLIRLWVGDAYSNSYILLLVLLAGYCPMLSQLPCVSLLMARGDHRLRGWWTLAEGAANLALSIYWGRKFGLLGIALGTTVPMVIVNLLIQPWYTLRSAAIPLSTYLREGFGRPLLTAGIFVAVCAVARPWDHSPDVVHLVFTIAWQCALSAALIWFVGMRPSERARLLESAHLRSVTGESQSD